jgi:hypothetical protein
MKSWCLLTSVHGAAARNFNIDNMLMNFTASHSCRELQPENCLTGKTEGMAFHILLTIKRMKTVIKIQFYVY